MLYVQLFHNMHDSFRWILITPLDIKPMDRKVCAHLGHYCSRFIYLYLLQRTVHSMRRAYIVSHWPTSHAIGFFFFFFPFEFMFANIIQFIPKHLEHIRIVDYTNRIMSKHSGVKSCIESKFGIRNIHLMVIYNIYWNNGT